MNDDKLTDEDENQSWAKAFIMHLNNKKVIYCDTDSILINNKIKEKRKEIMRYFYYGMIIGGVLGSIIFFDYFGVI